MTGPGSPDNRVVTVAIVSRPGMLQQSLRSALAACPNIAVQATLGDGLSALNHVVAHPPYLLVVDCNLLDEEVAALLAAIKAQPAPVRCLVLTRTERQVPWARAAGADAAIPRDGSHQALLDTLAQLAPHAP